MNRQTIPIVMGVVAAVAAFVVWWALDNSVTSALVYGAIAGVLAAAVSNWQQRGRR
jgi:hypothetical protein